MAQLAERIISDLCRNGLSLEDAGEGWFALYGDLGAGRPNAYLRLVDADMEKYLQGMSREDVDGAFGPDVTLDDARYRLSLIHLEESLLSHHEGVRFVVVEGTEIRILDGAPPAVFPPGDYEWRA
jgi:hypothetical protein